MDKIRLPSSTQLAIISVFKKHFSPQDHMWLFGSRTDLTQRGGDIDLYIETVLEDSTDIFKRRIAFLVELKKTIGDQQIDVIINKGDHRLDIYEIAKRTGVQLA